MKKVYLALILALSSAAFAQTHTFAALDTQNNFTNVNNVTNAGSFSGATENEYLTALINGITTVGVLTNSNQTFKMTNGIVGGVAVPVGATTTTNNGVIGLATTLCNSSSRTVCNAVGVSGYGQARATSSAAWGANFSCADAAATTLVNCNGIEIDMGISGNEVGGYYRGISIPLVPAVSGGLPGTMPTNSIGIELGGYDDGGGHTAKWTAGFLTDSGAVGSTGRGLELGATAASGTSVGSQTVAFDRFDSGSAFHIDQDMIHETSTGVLALNTTNPTLGVSVSGTAATWTSGAGAASGNCTVGSIYTNTSAASTSTVLYVCQPANSWTAVTVP